MTWTTADKAFWDNPPGPLWVDRDGVYGGFHGWRYRIMRCPLCSELHRPGEPHGKAMRSEEV